MFFDALKPLYLKELRQIYVFCLVFKGFQWGSETLKNRTFPEWRPQALYLRASQMHLP